jgi:hypothetical protein
MIKGYADLGDFDEDERIEKIGQAALSGKQTSDDKPLIIGFVVDDDGGTKGDRYIRKLQERFPTIRIIDRHKGPVPKTELIRVGPLPR